MRHVCRSRARLLGWRCADLVDRGEPFGTAASKAKLFASEAAVREEIGLLMSGSFITGDAKSHRAFSPAGVI